MTTADWSGLSPRTHLGMAHAAPRRARGRHRRPGRARRACRAGLERAAVTAGRAYLWLQAAALA